MTFFVDPRSSLIHDSADLLHDVVVSRSRIESMDGSDPLLDVASRTGKYPQEPVAGGGGGGPSVSLPPPSLSPPSLSPPSLSPPSLSPPSLPPPSLPPPSLPPVSSISPVSSI